MVYAPKDISVIIATINRPKDLKLTLDSMKPNLNSLCEVIIVDQSKDAETKKVALSYKSKKIKYFHSNIAGLTRARNLGVKNSSKLSKIICFFDDDVTLKRDYFDKICEVYNEKDDAIGVSAHIIHDDPKNKSRFYNFIRKIFFLGHLEESKARVRSSYGNTYPRKINEITKVEWLSGVNCSYKKEVFKEHKFDENLFGYCLAEDLDFSYRVYMEKGGLYLTPKTKVVHRFTPEDRLPTKKIVFMNQINHFYFNFKNFNKNIKEKIIFAWSIVGISTLRILSFLKKRDVIESTKLKLFFRSIFYCIINLNHIRKGNLEIE